VDYYRTPEGKEKKKEQNAKRGTRGPKTAQEKTTSPEPDQMVLDAQMVGYVRMVTSLIEGWRVSRDEVVQMLERAMRQHSIVRRRKIDYILEKMSENMNAPP